MTDNRRKKLLARWSGFKALYRGNPALEQETLYAIPEKLLSAIAKEAPSLLSAKERRFERDLSRYGGVGFHRGSPISFPFLPESQLAPLDAEDRKWNRRLQESATGIRQLEVDLMRSMGRSELQVDNQHRRTEGFRDRILQRQRGYVGWLLTEPAFRSERDAFCAQWQKESRGQMRAFGTVASLSWPGFTNAQKVDPAFRADTVKFLWKWGLQALETYELPVPIDPGLDRPNLGSPHNLRAAGTVLFVPWYLVVDKNLRLEEIIEHHRTEVSLPHLGNWIRGRQNSRWGFARYAVMLQLYVWIELALARRYPERLRGQVVRLDRAFARFELGGQKSHDTNRLDRRADGIRRIRVEMEKRLGLKERAD
jgi:hypothetical protein